MGIAHGGLTTWFSGKSAPEDREGPQPMMLFLMGFGLYSPVGMAVLVASFIAFNYYRVSHKVIAGLAAAYAVPVLAYITIFSSTGNALAHYHRPFRDLFRAAMNKNPHGWLAEHWLALVWAQLPMSLLYGLTAGALFTTWKWIRRPVWEDKDRRPGPIHNYRRRQTIRAIAADLDGPEDGSTIGVDPYGKRIVQTRSEAEPHTLIAGGSGAGKTTTMMIGMRDAIRRGEAVCVVDLKGAADLPKQLAEWSERYGRRFLHWSITDHRVGYRGPADGPAFYDPIGRGDPSRKKDLLIGSEKWDVEYYKSVNENYLQTAFKIADLVPNPQVDAFTDLAALLDVDKLKARCAALFVAAEKTPEGQQHAAAHRMQSNWSEMTHTVLDEYVAGVLDAAADLAIKPIESEMSAIRNMAARVQKLRQSTAGHWLKRDPKNGRDIDLRRAADEGWVVVFTLDSSKYAATSAQIGGLIIQDLNTLSSELRNDNAPHPFHIYIDEFSAVGSDNVLGLLARGRDAHMPVMLSTQALGDIRRVDPAFLDQVLGIVNCFILHRTNHEEDAEIFAGLTGKTLRYIKRYGVEMASGLPGGIATGSATGQGHIEQKEDHIVPASAFQALARGHLVYIAKSPKSRVLAEVEVIREDGNLVAQAVAFGEAPTPAPTATTPAQDSPFAAPAVEDSSQPLPSPWPTMAARNDAPTNALDTPAHSQGGKAAVAGVEGGHRPVSLQEVTAMQEAAPAPAPDVPEIDFSEPLRGPERPSAGGVGIDPAAYLGDGPRRLPSDTDPDAAEATVPSPPMIVLDLDSTKAADVAPASTSQDVTPILVPEVQRRTPSVPEAALPELVASPHVPLTTGEDPDGGVFGGANVEWEMPGGDWVDEATARPTRSLPMRRPTTSGNAPKVPNTPEVPSQARAQMYDENEWK